MTAVSGAVVNVLRYDVFVCDVGCGVGSDVGCDVLHGVHFVNRTEINHVLFYTTTSWFQATPLEC